MRATSNWSLRELYTALFRYKRRAALLFALIVTVTVLTVCFSPRVYQSESKLFVRVGRESVTLDPTAAMGTVIGMNVSRESEINSMIEVMRSRSMVEKVVETFNPTFVHATPQQRDAVVRSLRKRLTIESPRQTNVIILSCKAASPQLAQTIVSTFVDVFLDEHLRINSTPGSLNFFVERCESLKSELNDVAAKLQNAKSRFGLVSVESRRKSLQDQISAVKSRSLETETALKSTDAKITAMRQGLEYLPDMTVQQLFGGPGTSAAANMRQHLYQLQTREQAILSVSTPLHPAAIAVRQQILAAKKILANEQPNHGQSIDAVVLTDQTNADSLKAQEKSLSEQISRLMSELKTLNEQEVLINDLQRQMNVLEREYELAAEKLSQARVGQALRVDQISNIGVIQPATFVPKRVSPRIRLSLLVGLVLATCSAFGIVLISDALDHSLRTPEDVEAKLGLPTLVSIPRTNCQPLSRQASL